MTEWLKTEMRRVMLEKHLTQKGWSVAAGLSETYVKDIFSGKSLRPSVDGLRKLARAAGLPASHFLNESENDLAELAASNVKPAIDAPSPGMLRSSSATVPIWGTSIGDGAGEGFQLMGGTIIGQAPRFACLEGRNDIRALYMVGDSMSPWRRAGGLIYMEEHRAANPGDHVLVEHEVPGSSVKLATVRLLVLMTAKSLRLGQYNPRREAELDRKRVSRMLRVLEWDELLGVR